MPDEQEPLASQQSANAGHKEEHVGGGDLEKRVVTIEEKLKGATRTTVLIGILGPLIGGGGALGYVQWFGSSEQRKVENELKRQEVRIREQEAKIKEQEAVVKSIEARKVTLDTAIQQHNEIVAALERQISQLKSQGRNDKAQELISELEKQNRNFIFFITASEAAFLSVAGQVKEVPEWLLLYQRAIREARSRASESARRLERLRREDK